MNDLNPNSGSSYKLEIFFEMSPDLLCIAGYDGFFKRINPSVSKLLGYTNEELYSKPINEFIYFEDRAATSKVREELTKRNPLFNFENRYVTKSGEIVWLSWTSLPFDNDKVIFAIAKNITHKKRHEDERNSLLVNLTSINKSLKQLSYKTSHDLRSPVNNLLSIFGLLDVSKINDAETVKLINMLKLASENLQKTLNNYVDVIGENVGLQINSEELNLNECLNDVLLSINSLIETSKATINIDFSGSEKVKFNKAYLESIFLNLITNAIKYAKPGRSPVISILSRKVEGIDQLIISDNGLGFEMEKVKDKIFGLHQKFHNHIDSKGIGLYLVYNHVINLGGRIDVESKVHEGTKFTISFKSEV